LAQEGHEAMMQKQLYEVNLDAFLDRLRQRGEVYAPLRDPAGDVMLAATSSGKPIILEYSNFPQSAKSFFLPQTQTLLHFRDGRTEEPPLPNQDTVLFGVRPCDARALLALDKVFLDDSPFDKAQGCPEDARMGSLNDLYYAHLRVKTAVIVLACARPMVSCFCTSVGGGPADPSGADVLAVRLESDLLLTAQTRRGEEILSLAADLLADPAPAAAKQAEEQVHAAEEQMAPVKVSGSAQRLREAYDSPLWEAASRKCLGCGACSFLCPTCHCFDITDELRNGAGRRVRTWDCCAYPLFTLHASGHNPRPTPKERWRQRIMHKFRYAVENFNLPFCVGCGRCIRHCPVSLDLRTVLKEV
jgi:ferredoxin